MRINIPSSLINYYIENIGKKINIKFKNKSTKALIKKIIIEKNNISVEFKYDDNEVTDEILEEINNGNKGISVGYNIGG